MNLEQLATEPQLIKCVLDDEETLEQYAEALEFWVWDKQPITNYARFMTAETADPTKLLEFCQTMILNSSGEPVITQGKILPTQVMVKAVNKVVERMGKL